MRPRTVDIVIVNWNGLDYCKSLFPTLRSALGALVGKIIVVDNGSVDGSVEWIRENCPGFVLIESSKNLGYAGGNNLGLQEVESDYVLLLNNDTEISDDRFLEKMISLMESNKQISVVGPTLVLRSGALQSGAAGYDSSLHSFSAYFLFLSKLSKRFKPFYISQYDYQGVDGAIEVGWVSGASMLVRTLDIRKVGGVPSDYFMYAEDVKLCRLIRENGGVVAYLPCSRIIHFHGGSENSAGIKTRWIDSTIAEYGSRAGRFRTLAARLVFSTGFVVRGFAYAGLMVLANSAQARLEKRQSVKRMLVYAKASLFG